MASVFQMLLLLRVKTDSSLGGIVKEILYHGDVAAKALLVRI